MRCVGGGEEAYAHLRAAALCRTVHVVGLAGKVQAAGQHTLALEADGDAARHRIPDLRQVLADALALALVDHVADLQTRLPTPAHDAVHRRERVHGGEGLLVGALAFLQLRVRDDGSSAHRVVGLLTHLGFSLHCLDRHSIHVECERLVWLPDERHLLRLQLVLDRNVRHMALARSRKRAIENDDIIVALLVIESLELLRRKRGAHGM